MKKLVIPRFATEREEAEWWDAHMDIVGSNLIEAMANGTAGRGTAMRLMKEARECEKISLPITDLDRVRALSKKKRLDYETYVKTLFHEAIEREEAALKKGRRHRRRTSKF
jgi:hypothetical protein